MNSSVLWVINRIATLLNSVNTDLKTLLFNFRNRRGLRRRRNHRRAPSNDDFCVLPELNAINSLLASSQTRLEDVGTHTRTVVDNLRNCSLYTDLPKREEVVVEFSAYLHDLGLSKSQRVDQSQPSVGVDYPAKAIAQVRRIKTEDIEGLVTQGVEVFSPQTAWLANFQASLPELRDWVLQHLEDDQ